MINTARRDEKRATADEIECVYARARVEGDRIIWIHKHQSKDMC